MRLFSLISGIGVRLSKGKVIPKNDYEKLITAIEMIEATKEDIEKAKKKNALETEKLRKEAKEKGFEEGLHRFYEHFFIFEEKIKYLHVEMQKVILPLVLKSVKKILGSALDENPELIVDIVNQSIKGALQSKFVKIYVNKKDLPILEQHKEEFKDKFELLEHLSFDIRSDVDPGGAIIETEKGIINATLENQFRALERAFETFQNR